MTWQPTALKDRPVTWDGVMGQPVAVRFLRNSVAADRISPCYIFHGPSGTGKTTLARIFAAAINCDGVNKPCGSCAECVSVASGVSEMVFEQDAGGDRGVDMIDTVKERVNIAVPKGKYTVIILDEVHAISSMAMNSLLKILEEPPDRVTFLLLTTNPLKLSKTIRTRVMDVRINSISDDVIQAVVEATLAKAGISKCAGVAEMVAKQVARGSMREALHAADLLTVMADSGVIEEEVAADILGVASVEACRTIANAILDKDVASWLRCVHYLTDKGLSASTILASLHKVVRDLSVALSTAGDMDSFSGLSIEKLRPHITLSHEQLAKFEDAVEVAIDRSYYRAVDSRILVETVYLDFLYGREKHNDEYQS